MAVKAMGLRSSHLGCTAIAVAVGLGISLVAVTPAAAADTTPPELVDVSLSTDAVSVAGLNFKRVTILVHLTDDTGVVEYRLPDDEFTPFVSLTRDKPGGHDTRPLSRSSGTRTDGVWTADVLMPSTYDGTWRVSRVRAEDDSSNVLDVDPATIGIVRTLEVTGTRQPHLTLDFLPARPSGRARAHGRLTTDTGRPISGRVMFVEFVQADWPFPGPRRRVTTKADGTHHFRMPTRYDGACVDVVAPVPARLYFDRLTVAWITGACGGPRPASIPPPPSDTLAAEPTGNVPGSPSGLAALAALLSIVVLRRRLVNAHGPALGRRQAGRPPTSAH
jgi:hypothetical protein